jgi:protein-S-isoprenylcysteine O-methyltransferase Ste14
MRAQIDAIQRRSRGLAARRAFTFPSGQDTVRNMIATAWEFKNRATVFGLILGFSFFLYTIDHQNSAAVVANWLEPRLHVNADLIARLLLAFAALLVAAAALIRTWASSYLHATVVYAAQVKSDSLVAEGPYCHVRNPLYFANVLMVIGLGAMMSRIGFFVAVAAMVVFCYRLILREEAELRGSQGQQFENYTEAVPRLIPSPWPRIASSGRQASWTEGFKAEAWYWGIAAAITAFAITLKLVPFFVIFGASMLLFWLSSMFRQKKSQSRS